MPTWIDFAETAIAKSRSLRAAEIGRLKPDWKNLTDNLRPKGVSDMPYQPKPQFPVVLESGLKEIAVVQVKIAQVYDLAHSDPPGKWTRQDYMGESLDGAYETKIKDWRQAVSLQPGQVVTVAGEVKEWNGKRSLEIQRQGASGIALDGEPLAAVAPTPQPQARSQQGVAPMPATQKLTSHEYRAIILREMKDAMNSELFQQLIHDGSMTPAQALAEARPIAISIGIAILRRDVDDELPF